MVVLGSRLTVALLPVVVALATTGCRPPVAPPTLIGTFRSCGHYVCVWIRLHSDGRSFVRDEWRGARSLWFKGRWVATSDKCLTVETDLSIPLAPVPLEPQGSAGDPDAWGYLKTLEVCDHGGKVMVTHTPVTPDPPVPRQYERIDARPNQP